MKHLIPPHDIEAERAVIGALLVDQDFAIPFCSGVSPDVFYDHCLKRVFIAALDIVGQGSKFDIITIINYLEKKSDKPIIPQYIYDCIEHTPTAYLIEGHLKILKEKYALRQIADKSFKSLQAVSNRSLTISDYLKGQKELIEDITKGETTKFCLKTEVKKTLVAINSKTSVGIPTGFQRLDNKIGGLIPGELIVIAGRPSMGKTALSVGIISNLTAAGKRVLFFSLEMSTQKILRRLIALESGVNLERLKNGRLHNSDWAGITRTVPEISSRPLVIDERPGLDVSDIRQRAFSIHHKTPIDAIFIDYLQLMNHGQQKGDTETKAIGGTTKALKGLSKELSCPVVLLSQLNRAVESRNQKEPVMSDLRGSGSIEEDADVVIFPFRPEQAKEEETPDNPNRLIIAKHRDGGIGAIPIAWVKEQAKFEEVRQ